MFAPAKRLVRSEMKFQANARRSQRCFSIGQLWVSLGHAGDVCYMTALPPKAEALLLGSMLNRPPLIPSPIR
jgi:hypothetical protein